MDIERERVNDSVRLLVQRCGAVALWLSGLVAGEKWCELKL
jgi:hypothetical protein